MAQLTTRRRIYIKRIRRLIYQDDLPLDVFVPRLLFASRRCGMAVGASCEACVGGEEMDYGGSAGKNI